jgi:two-component system nitrogen regulation response regulator GlnG
MSPSIQAKVLRLLQDQRFERVGGNETIQTDVRVIAATNQNLPELVAAGRFRQDLFYRLNTYTVALPPLRGRRDDVQQLAEYFLRRHAAEVGRRVTGVAPEALRLLEGYDWPGNVRELQGAVKTALVNAISDVITPDCLPETIRDVSQRSAPSTDGSLDVAQLARQLISSGEGHVYRKVVMAVDRIVLDEALRVTEGNQVEASALLGISRTTLRAKLGLLRSPSRPETNHAEAD